MAGCRRFARHATNGGVPVSAWKEYSPRVAIAATVVASGLYFFQRAPVPHVEDVAEIIAAVQEREAWTKAKGDQLPAYGSDTNQLGFAMRWGDLYLSGMDAARRISQRPPSGTLWLHPGQPFPEDGDTIAYGAPEWYESQPGTWSLRLTNCVETVMATNTRHPANDGYQWLLYRVGGAGTLDATNTPLLSAAGLSGWESIGSLQTGWWQVIGNGGTNYLYGSDLPLEVAESPVFQKHPGDAGTNIRTLRKINLEESWNVLTNLRRTITFNAEAIGTQIITEWDGYYNVPPASRPANPRLTTISAYGNLALSGAITNYNVPLEVGGSHACDGYTDMGWYNIHQKTMHGVSCNFPIRAAFEQGKVRRIAYYLAPLWQRQDTGGFAAAWTRSQIEAISEICPLYMPDYGDPPAPGVSATVICPDGKTMSAPLTKIAEFYNPTNRPSFNISIPVTLTRQEPIWQDSYIARLEAKWYSNQIIIVVDWAWDYCPEDAK